MIKYTYDPKEKTCWLTVSSRTVMAKMHRRQLFNMLKTTRRLARTGGYTNYIRAIGHVRIVYDKHDHPCGYLFARLLVNELEKMEAWNMYMLREFGFTL